MHALLGMCIVSYSIAVKSVPHATAASYHYLRTAYWSGLNSSINVGMIGAWLNYNVMLIRGMVICGCGCNIFRKVGAYIYHTVHCVLSLSLKVGTG